MKVMEKELFVKIEINVDLVCIVLEKWCVC